MDYFSIIILIIVVFAFISDRKLKSVNEILKDNNSIKKKTNYVLNNLEILNIDMTQLTFDELRKLVKKSKQEYIMLKNEQINLKIKDTKLFVANYIYVGERITGFNTKYVYNSESKKISRIIKGLYVNVINYLNIFSKNDISTYVIIILKKDDLKYDDTVLKKTLISFIPSKITTIKVKDNLSKEELKKIYLNKIYKGETSLILKIFLLIISGSIITANLISNIINIKEGINELIISIIVYFCYSYVVKYIYKSIGNQKVIASYMFPIYFITYIAVIIYNMIQRRIKNVQAS